MKQNIFRWAFPSMIALTGVSEGSFVLVDNFEGYTAGSDLNGSGGWTANGDTKVLVDPDDAGNQALNSAETATVTTTNVHKAIPVIDQTSVGTIFFRARAQNPADLVIGSSDVAAPANWPDFEGYMRFAGGNIDVRDGGGFSNVGTYTAGEWYNVWLVLDHTTDTTTVHFNQGDADAPAAAGSGAFRTTGNTVHDDIINVFIRNNDPTNSGFVDDIYVDNTGANLTNPTAIPEPASSLLALLGLVFGLRRRRS
ncbi:PEP-CTERM sorting domain-containing protein [Akkermansiaceae bacterium]|nr:PEP-CTERM sorting domain-containing protein [Akkermansiaceae bacterium]MDA7934292.1 PEP-CTERM sorting domain-containing protein [Akkermansiaceae bacterium]MDA9830496.1 PEP-CTERM sorting domain-containing protein [Akkermansiaceae bacterium]